MSTQPWIEPRVCISFPTAETQDLIEINGGAFIFYMSQYPRGLQLRQDHFIEYVLCTYVAGPVQILGSPDDDKDHELTHSYVVDTFMETYGSQVESVDEVFGEDSPYAAIVKVL